MVIDIGFWRRPPIVVRLASLAVPIIAGSALLGATLGDAPTGDRNTLATPAEVV